MVALGCLLIAISAFPVDAQESSPLTGCRDFLQNPLAYYLDERPKEMLACGQECIRADVASPAREQVLTCLAALYHSAERDVQARNVLLHMLSRDPHMNLPYEGSFVPSFTELFYTMRDSLVRISGELGQPQTLTLAVGDIENNSIVEGKYDLDRFASGLTHIIMTDLQSTSPLKIVDRHRLSTLMNEIGMGSSQDVVNPKYGVPLGQLTGAQTFLFGSIMQTEKNSVRMDLRWVDTATSELLLSEGLEVRLESSKDLFELERRLLLDMLLPKIQSWVTKAGLQDQFLGGAKTYFTRKQQQVSTGETAYVDCLLASGEAMLAEKKGDVRAAKGAWQSVQSLCDVDPIAGQRVRAYEAHLALAELSPDEQLPDIALPVRR